MRVCQEDPRRPPKRVEAVIRHVDNSLLREKVVQCTLSLTRRENKRERGRESKIDKSRREEKSDCFFLILVKLNMF